MEGGGWVEREQVGGRVIRQAFLRGQVRFGREIGERQRYREIGRRRDRADNKNPKQSRVAQQVSFINVEVRENLKTSTTAGF
jgi:hypothetical protein